MYVTFCMHTLSQKIVGRTVVLACMVFTMLQPTFLVDFLPLLRHLQLWAESFGNLAF